MTLCSKMSSNLFALMQKKVNDARRECSTHDSNVDQELPLVCPSQDSLQKKVLLKYEKLIITNRQF